MPREISRDHPVWKDGTPTCPICGDEVTCESAYVDGNTQRATPYVCLPCDWAQTAPILTSDPADQELLDHDLWE